MLTEIQTTCIMLFLYDTLWTKTLLRSDHMDPTNSTFVTSALLPKDRTGQDRTGQDRTGQDRTGQDRTGQDRTGQDRTGQDRTGQDRTGQDRTGQDRTGQDRTGQDRTVQDSTGQDRTGQDRTGQDRTGQDRTGQDRTGQDRTGQDRTGQDRTGQDRTGQDRTGQDRTGQDRTGQDRTGQDRTYIVLHTITSIITTFYYLIYLNTILMAYTKRVGYINVWVKAYKWMFIYLLLKNLWLKESSCLATWKRSILLTVLIKLDIETLPLCCEESWLQVDSILLEYCFPEEHSCPLDETVFRSVSPELNTARMAFGLSGVVYHTCNY